MTRIADVTPEPREYQISFSKMDFSLLGMEDKITLKNNSQVDIAYLIYYGSNETKDFTYKDKHEEWGKLRSGDETELTLKRFSRPPNNIPSEKWEIYVKADEGFPELIKDIKRFFHNATGRLHFNTGKIYYQSFA